MRELRRPYSDGVAIQHPNRPELLDPTVRAAQVLLLYGSVGVVLQSPVPTVNDIPGWRTLFDGLRYRRALPPIFPAHLTTVVLYRDGEFLYEQQAPDPEDGPGWLACLNKIRAAMEGAKLISC